MAWGLRLLSSEEGHAIKSLRTIVILKSRKLHEYFYCFLYIPPSILCKVFDSSSTCSICTSSFHPSVGIDYPWIQKISHECESGFFLPPELSTPQRMRMHSITHCWEAELKVQECVWDAYQDTAKLSLGHGWRVNAEMQVDRLVHSYPNPQPSAMVTPRLKDGIYPG